MTTFFRLIIILFLVYVNHARAMEDLTLDEKDPPFFKIVLEDDIIFYLLGSYHEIPLDLLLSTEVIAEIKNINSHGAVLYLEHEISNEKYIEAFYKKQIENANLLNIIKSNNQETSHEIQEHYQDTKNQIIKIKEGQDSQIQVHQLFSICPLWLAAPILAVHQGIISFNQHGGFEHDLRRYPTEKGWDRWAEIEYLENNQDVILDLENSETQDEKENCKWITDTIKKLSYSPYKVAYMKLIEGYKLTTEYSWTLINRDDVKVKSVLTRNKKWTDKIVGLVDKKPHHSLLIVVGFGHLTGRDSGLINLLKLELNTKIKGIYVLHKHGSWVNISHNLEESK